MKFLNIALIISIIAIIPVAFTIVVNRKIHKYANYKFGDEDFKVAIWAYVINYLTLIIAVLFLGSAYFLFDRDGFDIISLLLAIIGVIIVFFVFLYGLYYLPRTHISICNGLFVYHNGKCEKIKLKLSDIRNAYLSNLYIVIDDGERFKKTVPVYFKNPAKIIAIINNYRKS